MMDRFLQLHYLTAYPPSNPNRDDLGRPKTARYGDVPRLRISSQAIKRAARTSPFFGERLSGSLGERTQRLGDAIKSHLLARGAEPEKALEIAAALTDVFGEVDKDKLKNGHARTRQLAFVSPEERASAVKFAEEALAGSDLPDIKDLKKQVFQTADGAADIAMFGRMLAGAPEFNRDAAVQVAHALTTHRAVVEDDYFTAVDDLQSPADEAGSGAGHVGNAGFGSGVYYLYVCVNRDLLVSNLDGDRAIARAAVEALVEALARTTPSGKRNSFANFVHAGFLLAERGNLQPRSLVGAFLKPVAGEDQMQASIDCLTDMRQRIDTAYGLDATESAVMDVEAGTGTLADVIAFSVADMDG